MVNLILLFTILCFFAYAIYDQFLMEKRKGRTKLKVPLKKQTKRDGIILIGLILILLYQSLSSSHQIPGITLFLLTGCIILILYYIFFRTPMLILKSQGFFYANLYIDYQKIQALNFTPDHILVIDLKNGKRLLAPLLHTKDSQPIIDFFEGHSS